MILRQDARILKRLQRLDPRFHRVPIPHVPEPASLGHGRYGRPRFAGRPVQEKPRAPVKGCFLTAILLADAVPDFFLVLSPVLHLDRVGHLAAVTCFGKFGLRRDLTCQYRAGFEMGWVLLTSMPKYAPIAWNKYLQTYVSPLTELKASSLVCSLVLAQIVMSAMAGAYEQSSTAV